MLQDSVLFIISISDDSMGTLTVGVHDTVESIADRLLELRSPDIF